MVKTTSDDLLDSRVRGRVRRPVWLYGATGKRNWSRPIEAPDRHLLKRIAETPLPVGIPRVKIPWGDLFRSGYHQGITHLHHFYTRRNLAIFATLWQRAAASPLRDALRFWLLSYNTSHGTLMTRVVAKQKQAGSRGDRLAVRCVVREWPSCGEEPVRRSEAGSSGPLVRRSP